MRVAFLNVSKHQFSSKINKDYTAAADKIKDSASKGIDAVTTLKKVLYSKDESAIQAALTDIQNVLKDIDSANEELSKAVDSSNNGTGTIYLAMAVVAAIISAASFIWAYRPAKIDGELLKARKAVAMNSLYILAGAGITYISFIFSKGSYYILYGPILVGAVLFVLSIINYGKIKRALKDTTPPTTPAA